MSYWGARLIRVCDMTHSYWGARLIRVCDMTHSCVWHDSLIRGTWLIYVTFMFYEGHIHNKTCLFCISYHGETWFEWYTRPPHTPLSSILHTHIYERIHEHIQGQDFMMVIWVSHIPHIDESCHTHEWVYIMSESYTTYRWVMSHTRMSLYHEWVIYHISMSHVTHMNESISYHGAWLIRVCDMTHRYVVHDSLVWPSCFMRGTSTWKPVSYIYHIVGHDSLVVGPWLIRVWYMTHSYDFLAWWEAHPPQSTSHAWMIVRHDSSIWGTWFIHMWDMTHLSALNGL